MFLFYDFSSPSLLSSTPPHQTKHKGLGNFKKKYSFVLITLLTSVFSFNPDKKLLNREDRAGMALKSPS
jgi:hypothetical protein